MTESPDIPVVLFPEKIVISCVTKSKGPLTKIIRINPETKELVKDGSECSMSYGTIKKIPISSPLGFANMLRSRATNQAIVHGICEHDTAKVITKPQFEKNPGTDENPIISRTKDCLKYSDGPGVILFDHDKSRALSAGSDEALAGYSPSELISVLARVHEIINGAAFVSTPSTSSCIYSAKGDLLRGEGTGSHIYFFVKKASDIPRYLETLGKRLFLAGFGRIEISVSGSLLTRTLIDLLVGSPERLDFVAGAVCEDGLRQELPFPVINNGELLDTETLNSLTSVEEKEYLEIVAGLSNQAKPNQERVVSEYVERESKKLVNAKNISIEDAIRIVKSRQDHMLEDEDLLYFSRHDGAVTVAEALLAGASFNKKSLADPLEPEYDGWSKSKAIFYWNDGKTPNIRSFAHGEIKYKFRQKEENYREKKELTSDEQAMFERFVFLASENKIIDTVGHDIKDSMMIERAFIVSQSGKIHEYIDAETGDVKKMPLTKHWLMSDKKKIASALQYHPGKSLLFTNGDGRNYFNTFRFPYQLADQLSPGEAAACLSNWNKIMDAVFHEHRGYLEDWLCFSVQQPEKRSGIMPLCISKVGLGKSLVMSIVARVVGHQNFSNGKILDVTGLGPHGQQWGDWIFNKKVSCIEEISPEGETGLSYKVLDALKDIITNETLPLNLKGGRNGTFPIFSNIIGFSNHNDCMKIPFDDRRMFVVDSTGQVSLSVDAYGEIIEWMKIERNIIAVYQYLLTREISKDFIPGRAKMTEAKRSLQAGGRSHMQQAFDIVAEQFPCDLLTLNELRLAVAQAMHHIDGGEGLVPANLVSDNDKQFRAIMQSMTAIVAGNKRIRIKRADGVKLNPSLIRVVRNKQDWVGATLEEIKTAMHVQIPYKWIRDDEEEIPF